MTGIEDDEAAMLLIGSGGVALQAVVIGLPNEPIGEKYPAVAVPIGEGIVPSGDLVVRAASDVVTVDTVDDDVVTADEVDGLGTPGMDVETGLCVVKGPGTGTGVVESDGGDGGASGCGAGMVESAKTLAADVSGC